MPNDPIESLDSVTDAKFSDLARVVPGAGAEVQQLFQGALYDVSAWRGAASRAESTINDLLDSEEHQFMSQEEKQARIVKAQRDFATDHAVSERVVKAKLTILESQAIAAAESDLELAPAADRALIRQDIERRISNLPKNASAASALLELAASNPKKYAAELVKDDFGVQLLRSVDEESGAASLRANIIALTPGSTQKAQAGRAILRALPQVLGTLDGLKYAQSARVEKAAKPRQPQTVGYRPDTLIPRR